MSTEFLPRGYHVHVYCQLSEIELCDQVRTKMLSDLNCIDGAGPVRNRPIGPHPLPMFEAWFKPDALGEVVPWMLANRGELSVMFHPITGDDYVDHAKHAFWIGPALPLDLSILK